MTPTKLETRAILLVEDNPGDVDLIREYLGDSSAGLQFAVTQCDSLASALERLRSDTVDVILLDLGLPDSQGLETFMKMHEHVPSIPVIVLTGLDDMELSLQAVKAGAADFLTKGRVDGDILMRAIRYAIERTASLAQLKEEKNTAQRYLDIAGVMMVAIDQTGDVVLVNKKACEILGHTEGEILGKNWFDNFLPTRYREEISSLSGRLLAGDSKQDQYHENPILTRTGEERWISWTNTVVTDANGTITGHLSSGEDITERKRAQEHRILAADVLSILNRPNEWEALIYDILQTIQVSTGLDAVGIRLEKDGDYPYAAHKGFPAEFLDTEDTLCSHGESRIPILDDDGNPALECMCGNVIRGRTDSLPAFFTEAGSFWTNSTTDLLASTTQNERQGPTRNVCNAFGYESVALIPVRSNGETIGLLQLNDKRRNMLDVDVVGFFERLTDSVGVAYKRQMADEQIRRLLERQTHINQLTIELGQTLELRETYDTICKHVSSFMDADAFIISAFDEEKQELSVSYVATQGQERDTSHLPPVPLAKEGEGMRSQVVRTRQPLVVQDWHKMLRRMDTRYRITSDEVRQSPTTHSSETEDLTRSALFVPMQMEGRILGVLQVQSQQLGAYKDDDAEMLAGLANVAATALRTSTLYGNVERDAKILRSSLEGTIRALADTTEARDPYTSGHQRRVAELSTAIAREMNWTEDEIAGLFMAGLVHDVGKIAIPAEILSKPGKLTDIEFSLIKAHAQGGYDILKGIEFPWPIAAAVLQHHERMDGSGYPNGVLGEGICREARILAVADVVEAMANHRPYRPALGIEAALDEIEKRRGELYAPAVVDACMLLFREKGLEFSE